MATKRVEAIFKLRRDNDYNYEKVKDTFIPAKGEVCLVDTARLGLCVKVGDGVSTYGSLEYVNTIFQMVTFVEGKAFVNDKEIRFILMPITPTTCIITMALSLF